MVHQNRVEPRAIFDVSYLGGSILWPAGAPGGPARCTFEPPSIWRGAALLDQAGVAAYFKDVRLAEQIIEDLNLNLRIWSKS